MANTPYSEEYRKKMQVYFRPEDRSNSIRTDIKSSKFSYEKLSKPARKGLRLDLVIGAVLFVILVLVDIFVFLPNSSYSTMLLLFTAIVGVFLLLLLFHKAYEHVIEVIGSGWTLFIVYVLLIVNMYLGTGVYSIEWAFLGFFIAAVIFKDSQIDSRFLILPALLLLGYVPFLLIGNENAFAETIAIFVYYFLVVGVGLQVIESVKEIKPKLDFNHFIKKMLASRYIIEAMIFTGLISIILIILNRFIEIDFWKWTSVYIFFVTLVFYVISIIEPENKFR